MIKKEEVVRLGTLSKPHGVKGEMQFTGDIDTVNELPKPFIICDLDGILVPFFIESIRPKSNTSLLIKLDYVTSEKEAAELIHKEVYYPSALLEGVHVEEQVPEIIGFKVANEQGDHLGVIADIDDSTENILLLIKHDNNEWMMPLADELIVNLDETNKVLTIIVPEGLLDL